VAPRIFESSGHAIALHADYRIVSDKNPATPGEVIALYLTGMGAVSPPLAAGAPGGDGTPDRPLNHVTAVARAEFFGPSGVTPASVEFAGMAPGYAGLYQVNVKVPPSLTENEYSVSVIQQPFGPYYDRSQMAWLPVGR
jgi:uncharacterized protein (TIGR03437 family)